MTADMSDLAAVTIYDDELDVLTALIAVYDRDRRATVRSVAAEAGMSTTTTFARLRRLRRLNLATWSPSRRGTLRPLVSIVAVMPTGETE